MKTDKTAEEILAKVTANYCREITEVRALQAMEEYGRQCWEASRKVRPLTKEEYDSPICAEGIDIHFKYTDYNNYIKTLKHK